MRLMSIRWRNRLPLRIKTITVVELAGLMDKRLADGLGFTGRRQWFSENAESVEYGLLLPVMLNRATMLRCKAVVAGSGGLVGGFLIDLTRAEYAHLPSLAGSAAGSYLRQI